MSREFVDTILASIERWNAGQEMDFETIDPDVEIAGLLSSVKGEPYRGHDGVRQWHSDIYEQFTEWRIDIDEIRVLDEHRYLAPGRVHLRGRASGVEFDQPLVWLFEQRDGKLLRMSVYLNAADALEAAGLRE
jgi:ketosteroid isomerase-like protein